MSAKPIMIQGTMSNAGKSLITAGLCRVFVQDGYKVAPFKSQNMALNSFVTADGFEMSRAQSVQAEACKKTPDVRMNPILLKPTTDVGSQLIVNGKVVGDYSAKDYFAFRKSLFPTIKKAYDSLSLENDIIVIEGAGSPAEINLKKNDIVNMGMAKLVNSPVLLVGDIDRGGVFAQLYGTIALLEPPEQDLVKGLVVNKFRGDKNLLKSGLDMIEDLTKKKIVGVCPYIKIDLEDEDSLSERLNSNTEVKAIDIVVVKTPHIANFCDFDIFERFANVSLRYVEKPSDLKKPDMVILPGTVSTIYDYNWLKSSGMELAVQKLVDKGTLLFGICGGYQMMGRKIVDSKKIETGGEVESLGYFDFTTHFESTKITVQDTGTFENVGGILTCLNGMKFKGYEIHRGVSDGAKILSENGNVYGTYMHGVFDGDGIAKTILHTLAKRKNITVDFETFNNENHKDEQFDRLADAIRNSFDMKKIYEIIGI